MDVIWQPLLALTLGLVLVAFVGAAAILWARRQYQGNQDEPTDQPSLEGYRKLLEDGTLDREEFERIRTRLRDESADPPPSAPTA